MLHSNCRDNTSDEGDNVGVPMVHVQLVQAVKLLPQDTKMQVQRNRDHGDAKPFMVEEAEVVLSSMVETPMQAMRQQM